MKTAYFGIDLFENCLPALYAQGCEIVRVFSIPDRAGEYDRSAKICRFAQEHGISVQTTRATPEDIRALEESGVVYTITAGYPWLIPVSKTLRQVNVHPAFLPIGRGAWPMPAAILKGVSSGVTLHKLTARFDEGDIVLREEIPLAADENLLSLTEKIQKAAVRLLGEFLTAPDEFWQRAVPQGAGEYWQEPGDAERTIRAEDTTKTADLILRAFAGYGVLAFWDGKRVEILDGTVLRIAKTPSDGTLQIPLADGILTAQTWRDYD